MQELSGKRFLKRVGTVLLIFCLLTTIIVGWVTITNFNHISRFFSVLNLINSQYLEVVDRNQLFEGATQGIVDSLGDPYSTYMNASEYQQLMEVIEGKFGGVGIILSLKDPTKLVILRPIKNTPADKAGVQMGDIIKKIDNVDTSTIDQEKAVSLMRGDPGTKVTLILYRESLKEDVTITLTREKIVVPTVDGKALPGHSDIAYIDVSQFSSDTGKELAEVLKSMDIHKYKGLILDLRYNHGGELNAAVQVAGYFTTPGPVVYIVDKKGNMETKSSVTETYLGLPLVVLINEESASAAEIVAGAIKDKGTGTLIGVKTFGKGIVQTIFPLDRGTSVKLTTAKYLTPNKLDIHMIGIEPDIKVELSKDEEATLFPVDTDFDPQLEKAYQVLRSKIR
ncbi:MAG: S41 family peptidase [Desulfitobacteriaceae bacterium]|nr:S41 family peptidase [Desulfitobacteriaceae bacterium]MDD4345633.1 S41 family peptidase [Desulfitobacteriaceae bacterium]MDD4400450.1 S41 family peptidase [Desulfitobacteriaceae bacterium]